MVSFNSNRLNGSRGNRDELSGLHERVASLAETRVEQSRAHEQRKSKSSGSKAANERDWPIARNVKNILSPRVNLSV
jgi:hypothetical protein